MIKRLLPVLVAAVLLSACTQQQQQQPDLRQRLECLTDSFPGSVGIALINGNDTVCIDRDGQYPLFSVVKFHLALAVCEQMRSGHFMQPYDIEVTPSDLKPDTWSPMREQYPHGGRISVNELLRWSLVESDNNACDILFNAIARPEKVDAYIHDLGVGDCVITWTEDEQRADMARCYENWSTPLAAAELLGEFYRNRDMDEYSRFLWETMAGCRTGENRIPKYIADSTALIVHKTGTGAPLQGGGVMAINDIACIVLPDGSHFELAVFIKDATCEASACEELIAEIAETCFTFLSGF